GQFGPLGVECLVGGFEFRCSFLASRRFSFQRRFRLLGSRFRLGFRFCHGSLGVGLQLGNRSLRAGVSLACGFGLGSDRRRIGIGLCLGNRRLGHRIVLGRGSLRVRLCLCFLRNNL